MKYTLCSYSNWIKQKTRRAFLVNTPLCIFSKNAFAFIIIWCVLHEVFYFRIQYRFIHSSNLYEYIRSIFIAIILSITFFYTFYFGLWGEEREWNGWLPFSWMDGLHWQVIYNKDNFYFLYNIGLYRMRFFFYSFNIQMVCHNIELLLLVDCL